jgi:hypothetical protein
VQYFGAVLITAGFSHISWFNNGIKNPIKIMAINLPLGFGLQFFLIGHSGNLPTYSFFLGIIGCNALMGNLYRIRKSKETWLLIFLGIVLIVPTVIDLYIESKAQPGSRLSSNSLFLDAFHSGGILRLFKHLIVSSFWPLANPFIDETNLDFQLGHKGFVSILGIIALSMFALLPKLDPKIRRLEIGFALSVFVGMLQMNIPNLFGALSPSANWISRDPILIATSIGLAIVWRCNRLFTRQSINYAFGFALLLNALYLPSSVLVHLYNYGQSEYSFSNQINKPSPQWSEILTAYGVKQGDRVYSTNPDFYRDLDWFGLRSFNQLSSMGVFSINSWPKIRSSKTLSSNHQEEPQKFLNVIHSSYGCKPNEVQFLAVKHVFVFDDNCKSEYSSALGETGYSRIRLPIPPDWNQKSSLWLYTITDFPQTYLSIKQRHSVNETFCPLLSQLNCLEALGLKKAGGSVNTPAISFCPNTCIATLRNFSVSANSINVFPINYDKSMEAFDSSSRSRVKIFSYHGLVAVETAGEISKVQTIEIQISPDRRMLSHALSCWLTLFITVILVFCSIGRREQLDYPVSP